MDTEQIIELEPGLETDKLVAEIVMGWKHPVPGKWLPRQMVPPEHDGTITGDRQAYVVMSVPNYSTDTSAAWLIVNKFAPLVGDWVNSDGFFMLQYAEFADHSIAEWCKPMIVPGDLTEDQQLHDKYPWSCHFHVGAPSDDGECPSHWKMGDTFCALAETAEMAICKAALLSMIGTQNDS